ncbi:MAG: DNA-binding response regulator, partial [bacterium]|nr:DNA-binding response regulator [bacterium]
MQIALCDDEETYHEKTKELIRQYKQIHPDRTLFLSSFFSGKELINHVDEYGCFDLYILDCIMPEMTGIELGN